jgi:hypothetical protein
MTLLRRYWGYAAIVLAGFVFFLTTDLVSGERNPLYFLGLLVVMAALWGYIVFMSEKGGPAIGRAFNRFLYWLARREDERRRREGFGPAASAPAPREGPLAPQRESALPPLKYFAPITWVVVCSASAGVGLLLGAGYWVIALGAVTATGSVISLIIAARLERRPRE